MAASLLRDINATAASPRDIVPAGDLVYYTAAAPAGGSDLFRVAKGGGDATLLRHFVAHSTPYQSAFQELTPVGSSLFFIIQDPAVGAELWHSDGTAAGTTLVKDIRPGPGGSYPRDVTAVGSTVYFYAVDDGTTGRELWRTDGTEAGTTVLDIRPGPGSSEPSGMVALGSSLFFFGNDGTTGNELRRTDDTMSGTTLVADLVPGPAGNGASGNLAVLGEKLIFTVDEGGTTRTLWASDGTSAGTVALLARDFASGMVPDSAIPTVAGSAAFFLIHRPTGDDLWKTDGTTAGTTIVRDFAGGPGSAFLSRLVGSGDLLYFWARTAAGQTLWRSDGTPEGTIPLRQVEPIEATDRAEVTYAPASRSLVFAATDPTLGTELYASDGTPSGTGPLRDLKPGPRGSAPAGFASDGRVTYFRASDRDGVAQLFRTDGTVGGTSAILTMEPGETRSSTGDPLADGTPIGGAILFAADDGESGRGLWRTDGTPGGTAPVKSVAPDARDTVGSAVALDGFLYFGVSRGTADERGLWRTDGTGAGTVRILPIEDEGPNLVNNLRVVAGALMFLTGNFETGPILWRSDGTEAGTIAVRDLRNPYPRAAVTQSVVIGSEFYFLVQDGISGSLWRSNGTPEGTNPIASTVSYSPLAALGRDLVYLGEDDASGVEPRIYRGATGESSLLKDIVPGPRGAGVLEPVVVGTTLYFTSSDGAGRRRVWMSDGTEAGTLPVPGVVPLSDTSQPYGLGAFGPLLLFAEGTNGRNVRLWRTDGTAEGTFVLRDVALGAVSGYGPTVRISPIDGVGYFSADDGDHGIELWKTDGTAAGTVLVADLRAGIGASDPRILGFLPTGLVLSADDGVHGREPNFVALTDEAPLPPRIPIEDDPIPPPGPRPPASPTAPLAPDIPASVVATPATIRLFGRGHVVRRITMRIGPGLDVASASRRSGYRLVRLTGPGLGIGRRTPRPSVGIRSATYDPATGLVRLRLARGLVARGGNFYQLRLSGDVIRDDGGRGLDGDRDGRPGGEARFALFRDAVRSGRYVGQPFPRRSTSPVGSLRRASGRPPHHFGSGRREEGGNPDPSR